MIREYERKKDGFDIVMKSDGWQMAVVTYEEQYDEKKVKKWRGILPPTKRLFL